MQPWF